MTLLEEQVAEINERLAAQESHYEGIRSAILELRRELLNRYGGRDADIAALRQQMEELRQRIGDLDKTITSGLADVHRSFQMLIDRRDITLLQRVVDETIKRVQTLEAGQQALHTGQQRIEQTLQLILAKLG